MSRILFFTFYLFLFNSAGGYINNYNHHNGVKCPGGKTQCPDGQTCCEELNGNWGCCPTPNAVCCEDRVHCCPENYMCGRSGQCISQNGAPSITWLSKGKSFDCVNICGDGKSCCDSGETCCLDRTGGYSCCGLANAVCCDDLLHCCPQGTTCQPSEGRCTQSSGFGLPIMSLRSKAKLV